MQTGRLWHIDAGGNGTKHAALPTIPTGDVALELALAFEVDENVEEELFAPRAGTDLRAFVRYDAAGDRLFLSDVGFNDPNAVVISPVQARFGSDRCLVLLGAFTEGTAPAVPGGDFFLDDFVVETGTVVTLGIPGPPDINRDGTVDVLDLLDVLLAWGPWP